MQQWAVALILILTIAGLYLRPFHARDWHVALAGGLAAWLAGPLSLGDGLLVVRHSWNIAAFFAGLMLLGAGAEAAGFYERIAVHLRRARPGRPRTARALFTGAGITAILSNDATPLVLTPAVFAATIPAAATDAAFATTFAADGASLLLPISNPVNLLFYEHFQLSFSWYMLHVFPAALAGFAALAAVVLWRAGPSPRGRPSPPLPAATGRSRFASFAAVTIAALAVAYIAAGVLAWPLGLVTLSGGSLLLAGRALLEPGPFRGLRAHIAPGLIVFVVALLLLIAVVREAGVLESLGDAFQRLAGEPTIVTIIVAAIIATLLSNLMNNWPAALLIAAIITTTDGRHDGLILGSLIGCTIGANLTMVGSLSTVFWLSLSRQHGAHYTPGLYARRAALPTVAALITASLAAALLLAA